MFVEEKDSRYEKREFFRIGFIVMNAECKFSGHRTLAKKFRDVKKLTFFVKTLKKWTRIIRLTHKVLGDDLNCENYNQQCFCNVFGKAQFY